ncbi:MAG: 3',5'-cyclic adenosine monophosphate phosphodiesterase CpdA [Chlamydiae bacterium]|nr:3',5'-cyclic adenosine monophosphate phosphodiesterase CpdA [Chlamydiota bacterium]
MAIWAIGDLHLAFGAPEKSMEVFGPTWNDYANRVEKSWKQLIKMDDLVLIPGDICWAKSLEEALIDLKWIDALPGTKVILKGNHDYWWPSNKKLSEALPPSIYFVNNTAFNWNDVTIGGSRLWDSEEYSFESLIEFRENPLAKPKVKDREQDRKIFQRELERLKLSLQQLDSEATLRIAMTHYPPISADLKESETSKILEEYAIDICVFGHLHNVKKERPLFGEKNKIRYLFTSADYLDFKPLLIRQ